MIICSDLIEHLKDPSNLIELIKMHLDEKGICILSTPDRDLRRNFSNNRSPNKEHVREWNKEELKKYMLFSGFNVIEQINLPLGKLNPMVFRISRWRMFYRKFNNKKWYPNQTLALVHKKSNLK